MIRKFLYSLLILAVISIGQRLPFFNKTTTPPPTLPPTAQASVTEIPAYTGKAYTVMNNNMPLFTEEDTKRGVFEAYAPLDSLGRCGPAFACVGKETMPTEPRGKIGMVKPSGWQLAKYSFVDQKYLYNRCHLIAFMLAGENANPQNLITGTRYMNVIGMLPFENRVNDYIRSTKNHVLYRVTPLFQGNDLVARGVEMEAWSVEDNGKLHFHVFCHNVQPRVKINYANGKSYEEK